MSDFFTTWQDSGVCVQAVEVCQTETLTAACVLI